MNAERRSFESEAAAAYAPLRRAASVLCASKMDVEDVVQETLVAAYRAFGKFRGESSFFSWSYRILVRTATRVNRSRLRKLDEGDPILFPECLPSADRSLMRQERNRQLLDSVRSLPSRQREMITLHFLEDLSYPEIAKALDVSVGTVKATLFEAKSRLRRLLHTQEELPKEQNVMPKGI